MPFDLMFYDNSKFVSFFNCSKKRKLDFHFIFSISVLLPAFPSLFLTFPFWFTAFPSIFPVLPPHFPDSPYSHPNSPHSHPYSLHSDPHSPHSSHSIPQFPIPVFTDSHYILINNFIWMIDVAGFMNQPLLS